MPLIPNHIDFRTQTEGITVRAEAKSLYSDAWPGQWTWSQLTSKARDITGAEHLGAKSLLSTGDCVDCSTLQNITKIVLSRQDAHFHQKN